MMTFLCYPR